MYLCLKINGGKLWYRGNILTYAVIVTSFVQFWVKAVMDKSYQETVCSLVNSSIVLIFCRVTASNLVSKCWLLDIVLFLAANFLRSNPLYLTVNIIKAYVVQWNRFRESFHETYAMMSTKILPRALSLWAIFYLLLNNSRLRILELSLQIMEAIMKIDAVLTLY